MLKNIKARRKLLNQYSKYCPKCKEYLPGVLEECPNCETRLGSSRKDYKMRLVIKIVISVLIISVLFIVAYDIQKEDSILESARKAGFEKPAEGSCPSCKVKIVVDLSAETSQCPYCKAIFLSESAVEQITSKRALLYEEGKEKSSPVNIPISGNLTKKKVDFGKLMGLNKEEVKEILGEPTSQKKYDWGVERFEYKINGENRLILFGSKDGLAFSHAIE